MVVIQVDKDAVSHAVTVSIAGGPGLPVVRDMVFRLTRSDGQVLESTIVPDPQKKANEAELPGTRYADRVEAIVDYYSGQQYEVMDQLVE
jgi:hypothetical protein